MSSILHAGSKTLDISQPVVMGILNATPDSFYNKGKSSDVSSLLQTAEKMLKDGASILDIGGASTKPGQQWVTADEELKRVMPVIEAVVKQFPGTWLSVDTYNAAVARAAVEAGVSMVNDVTSGIYDKEMVATVAALGVPYIIMHMQGTPATMQQNPTYADVVRAVDDFFAARLARLEQLGVAREQVALDPGIGFGKTLAHNLALLAALPRFQRHGRPLVLGVSRKSFLGQLAEAPTPAERLPGSLACAALAVRDGVQVLRVHDVRETVQAVRVAEAITNARAD